MHALARRVTLRACALAAGVALVVTALPPLLGAHYYGRDLWWMDTGLLCALKGALAGGHGLRLTPWSGHGTPLFANPQAQLLYPLRWLAAALPPDAGTSFLVVARFTGAAAATAWLARTFRVRPAGAAAAGLAFASCGTLIDLVTHAVYFDSATWVPLAWAAARRACHPTRGARFALALLLALALDIIAGDPHGYAMGGGLALAEAIRLLVASGRRARPRALAIVGAVALAPLLAAPALLPTLAEAALIGRLDGNLETALAWSLSLPGALAVALPVALSASVGEAVSFAGAYDVETVWNGFPYLGPLVLAAALRATRRKQMVTASVALVGSFVFALGSAGLVYPVLLRVVPLLSSFRYPEKYLLVTSLAATVLAASALSRAARRPDRPLTLALVAGGAGVLVLAAWIGLGAPANAPALAAVVQEATLLACAPLGVTLACLFRPALRPLTVWSLPVALAIAAAGQIKAGPSPTELPFYFDGALPEDAVVCRDPRLFGVGTSGVTEHTGWEAHVANWALGVGDLAACHEVASGVPYSPLRTSIEAVLERRLDFLDDDAARALGCTHFETRPVGGSKQPVLRALADAAPPAFIVPSPRAVTPTEVLNAALNGDPLPGLIDDPRVPTQAPSLPAAGDARLGAARFDAPHQIEVTAAGAGGAVIAFRRSYRAGWSAEQDGVALPVVRVRGTLLGVAVTDASRGPVALRYRVPRLVAGVALSGLAMLLVLALALGRRVRRGRADRAAGS